MTFVLTREPTLNFYKLSELDNKDKHRMLVPVVTLHSHHIVSISEDQEDNPPTARPGAILQIGGQADATTVFSNPRYPRPGTKAAIFNSRNGYASVEVKFPKGEEFEDQAVIESLKELAELVSGIIDKLEACCRK